MSRNSSKQNYTQLMEWLKVNKIRTVKTPKRDKFNVPQRRQARCIWVKRKSVTYKHPSVDYRYNNIQMYI